MAELAGLFEELENSLRVCHVKFTENCKICTLARDEVADFKEAHKGWAEKKAKRFWDKDTGSSRLFVPLEEFDDAIKPVSKADTDAEETGIEDTGNPVKKGVGNDVAALSEPNRNHRDVKRSDCSCQDDIGCSVTNSTLSEHCPCDCHKEGEKE